MTVPFPECGLGYVTNNTLGLFYVPRPGFIRALSLISAFLPYFEIIFQFIVLSCVLRIGTVRPVNSICSFLRIPAGVAPCSFPD